jgi:hypothetical protein
MSDSNILQDDISKIFDKVNVYVEIFNKNMNESDCVIPMLETNGATVFIK